MELLKSTPFLPSLPSPLPLSIPPLGMSVPNFGFSIPRLGIEKPSLGTYIRKIEKRYPQSHSANRSFNIFITIRNSFQVIIPIRDKSHRQVSFH